MRKQRLRGLFFVCMLLMSFVFVSAAGDEVVEGTKSFVSQAAQLIGGIIGAIGETMGLSGFVDGGEGIALAQFLLMFITIMLIYSALDFLALIDKEWAKWLIAVAAGILAFIFIEVDTIRSLADQYAVMAIALNVLLPGIIVLTFIWRINVKAYTEATKMTPGVAKWVGIFTGVGLIVYLVSAGRKFGELGWIGIIGKWIIGIIIIAALIMVIWGGKIVGKWALGKGKAGIEKSRSWLKARKIAKLGELEEEIDSLLSRGDTTNANIAIGEYNSLAKRIKHKSYQRKLT